MEGIGDLVWLKHGQCQQLIGWCCGERGVLFGRQGAKTMTGLRCDDDTSATGRDDVPELFEHQRSSIQVDSEDDLGLCLTG